jgi:hypothetical protein
MDRRTQIVYNQTGQVLELYPPEWVRGVPSGTTTYSVWAGTAGLDTDAEFSGNATSDSVATTVDAASGVSQSNRRRINLTATTNIVKDYLYVVTTTNGESELVKVVGINSANYVDVECDLAYDYANTNTFKGLRQYFTIDATFVATQSKINDLSNPYKIRWKYTIGTTVYYYWTFFDLVRMPVTHSVNIYDVMAIWPDIWQEEPESVYGSKWYQQINMAWDQVAFDLRNYGVETSQIRDADRNMLTIARFARNVAEMGITQGGLDPSENLRVRSENYSNMLEQLAGRMKLDQGTSGALTTAPIRQTIYRR